MDVCRSTLATLRTGHSRGELSHTCALMGPTTDASATARAVARREAHKQGAETSRKAEDLVEGDGDKVGGMLREVEGLGRHKCRGVEQDLPRVRSRRHRLHSMGRAGPRCIAGGDSSRHCRRRRLLGTGPGKLGQQCRWQHCWWHQCGWTAGQVVRCRWVAPAPRGPTAEGIARRRSSLRRGTQTHSSPGPLGCRCQGEPAPRPRSGLRAMPRPSPARQPGSGRRAVARTPACPEQSCGSPAYTCTGCGISLAHPAGPGRHTGGPDSHQHRPPSMPQQP